MRTGLETKTIRFGLTKQRKSFLASAALDFLVEEELVKDRLTGVLLCQKLATKGHLCSLVSKVFRDNDVPWTFNVELLNESSSQQDANKAYVAA